MSILNHRKSLPLKLAILSLWVWVPSCLGFARLCTGMDERKIHIVDVKKWNKNIHFYLCLTSSLFSKLWLYTHIHTYIYIFMWSYKIWYHIYILYDQNFKMLVRNKANFWVKNCKLKMLNLKTDIEA